MDFEFLENAIRVIFGKKGERVVDLNLQALKAGKEFADLHLHK
jgi:indolepyruvate ferredoxin oxidoreductase beta subunit